MDVVGSEIGQKMRSAIKAKLTELGCYVDDELPDYVMVMVANKRTRSQMDEDLQLFLGDNTELFVNWLHQVLKKLQEVTVTAPLKAMEAVKTKERSESRERKSKEKKEKGKKKSESSKKAKKREKEKLHKDEKKAHKSKKKSKHEMIRPNVPPLLMNIEKESEPSITDVFAGQILKNHGITLEDDNLPQKLLIKETKRPILPIIDPATISSQPESVEEQMDVSIPSVSVSVTREEHLRETNDLEAKAPVSKNKLSEQLDSMSDDEDFLNIRTEAEELMNDFAEEPFQEISKSSAPVATPPPPKNPLHSQPVANEKEIPQDSQESFPQIELNLPKRPVRERLGARDPSKEPQVFKEKVTATKAAESPERFTPERQPNFAPKSAKSRLGTTPEPPNTSSSVEDNHVVTSEQTHKRASKVSVLEGRPVRASCASVVRVRPRPRVSAPASNLLLKAVADAHKSLLNAPPKVEIEKQKVKRALVLPMRRCVDAQNIVIQVPSDVRTNEPAENDTANKQTNSATPKKEDFKHMHITKVIKNTDYVPIRTATRKDDKRIIETINIHNPTVDKDKDTQFIVTMDGYLPNAFLAKKLMMEGILDEEDINKDKVVKPIQSVLRTTDKRETTKDKDIPTVDEPSNKLTCDVDEKSEDCSDITTEKVSDTTEKSKNKESSKAEKKNQNETTDNPIIEISVSSDSQKKRLSESSDKPLKRLSNTSEESDTQVIIKQENLQSGEKRKSSSLIESQKSEKVLEVPQVKKRKASPIVFDTDKVEKEAERVRERTHSASSDSHVIVTTTTNSHKYDGVPPLSQAEKKLVWCRSFPLCRFGSSCAFAHPRCKFAAACTRRGCVYAHATAQGATATSPTTPPAIASHVVPAANYKSIVAATAANTCKFYPNCVNPTCHFYHPKPCRYGKSCVNKLECNFYHNDVPPSKWKYPV